MPPEGLHHIAAITADAPGNVDFYARVLWRVRGDEALGFWSDRPADEGVVAAHTGEGLRFANAEGLEHELVAEDVPDSPLTAAAPDVPVDHALFGFAGVRAYGAERRASSAPLLQVLGFTVDDCGEDCLLAGGERRLRWHCDPPPGRGRQAAGSIHHVAWSAANDVELEHFRGVVARAGARPTPIIDRQYFRSVYFREPSGVLFELPGRDIGFAVDEPTETLGSALKLPPQYEAHRAQLEQALTPISNPRAAA